MSSQKKQKRQRIVPSERRKKYIDCLTAVQKIPYIESQYERLDVLDSVLDKYNLLSKSAEPAPDEPSSSKTEGQVVGTDERFLMSLVTKSSNDAFGRIIIDFNVMPSVFSIIDFADKLQPEEGSRYYDWEKMEVFSSTVFRTPPNLSSVWTGLDLAALEMKERAAKRQRMARKPEQEAAKKVVPSNVANENTKKSEEYRLLNKSLRRSFESNRNRPVNFFELLVDKESYPTTVENMFNFAFLIREDMANLKICEDGTPLVEPVVSKEEERKKKRHDETNQMILSFDYEKWQKITKHLEKQ
ncbi:hypothetical protein LSTR_LSTR008691 [Laodelphax striatellus]|uniref:Non-structural maintenance of chromosomes element 4 n=1 Tax=Laodelphax striatellus TaxID=195883 RepID=A0A482WHQ4_LAOST|nr:hypothetical protein LSTR_LSTR008691 [Laodelphax striatellus]